MGANETATRGLGAPSFGINGNNATANGEPTPLDPIAVSTTNGKGKPRKARRKETRPRDRVKPSNPDATRRCECTRPMLVHLPGRAEEAQRLQRVLDRFGDAIPERDQVVARARINMLLDDSECLKCGHSRTIDSRRYGDNLDIDPEVWPVLYELGLIGPRTTNWWSSSPMSSSRAGGKRKRR
jgi:hypothetical protein